ncbi:MAG TPA: TRAM domain-containing protein [Dongiaceae bacterium]|nr:TRAM domain-containing protein [Dongiaceae bacterium]
MPSEAEIEITALGLAGDGIGHLEGRAVFVPYAAPGDRLLVRLEDDGEGGWRGRILRRLQEGTERVQPPCPHFADCGGCSLQHLAPAAYRRWKQGLVEEALSRRGVETAIAPLLVLPPGGRRRAVLAAEVGPDGITLGFNAAGSSRVVDLTTCLLLTPKLQAFLAPLRRALIPVLKRRERADAMVTETDSGIDLWLQQRGSPGEAGRRSLIDLAEAQDLARISVGHDAELLLQRRLPGMLFGKTQVAIPPGAFLQPSALGQAALIRAVTAVLKGQKRIADLYAGCGTFTFALAETAKVHSAEGDPPAQEALAAAARGLGGRVTAERRDLARSPLTPAELDRFDALLLDPPRAGAKAQAAAIAASSLDLVAYVSCDPRSFARDARLLIDGGFRLERVLPIDQFPWSAHLELVGVFRR